MMTTIAWAMTALSLCYTLGIWSESKWDDSKVNAFTVSGLSALTAVLAGLAVGLTYYGI